MAPLLPSSTLPRSQPSHFPLPLPHSRLSHLLHPFSSSRSFVPLRLLPLRAVVGIPHRNAPLRVDAAVCYPASITWWKKGNQTNMLDINSPQEFIDALGEERDKLVLVEFFSVGCRSCKAVHPKVCQIAADNPDIVILKVNFHDNLSLCRSLDVKVLPFFHFYRGAENLIDAFSCTLTKINKLKAAVAKHKDRDLQVGIATIGASETMRDPNQMGADLQIGSIAAPGPMEPLNDLNELLGTSNAAIAPSGNRN